MNKLVQVETDHFRAMKPGKHFEVGQTDCLKVLIGRTFFARSKYKGNFCSGVIRGD
jgi:hypothetical protein